MYFFFYSEAWEKDFSCHMTLLYFGSCGDIGGEDRCTLPASRPTEASGVWSVTGVWLQHAGCVQLLESVSYRGSKIHRFLTDIPTIPPRCLWLDVSHVFLSTKIWIPKWCKYNCDSPMCRHTTVAFYDDLECEVSHVLFILWPLTFKQVPHCERP